MIDALFGSKTRVKLLYLFLSHPDESYYVREITRVIDEQINSVRRELSNMINVGVVVSYSSDNKLYYRVNHDYQYFNQLSSIFSNNKSNGDAQISLNTSTSLDSTVRNMLSKVASSKLILISGKLVDGSVADIDILIAGSANPSKIKTLVGEIEKLMSCEINYVLIDFDDFYYRLSVRDSFITNVLNGNYVILKDTEKVLS